MRHLLAVLLSFFLMIASAQAQSPAAQGLGEIPSQPMQAIEMRALNKITARTSLVQVNIGEMIQFDQLQLQVRTCWSAPPDQKPEHAALLHITQMDPDTGPEVVFHGWMFASSPALNALEHAVYDITVMRCLPSRVKAETLDDTLE